MEHMMWVFFNVLHRPSKLCLNLPQSLQEADQCLSLWHMQKPGNTEQDEFLSYSAEQN